MKRLATIFITFMLCIALGSAVMATESPDAGGDPIVGGGHRQPTTAVTDESATSGSPVTGDVLVVPGLGILAVAGTVTAVTAKKKLKE